MITYKKLPLILVSINAALSTYFYITEDVVNATYALIVACFILLVGQYRND